MSQFWGFEEMEADFSRLEGFLTEPRPRRSTRQAACSPYKQTPDSVCGRPRFTDFRKDPFKVFNSADQESEHFL